MSLKKIKSYLNATFGPSADRLPADVSTGLDIPDPSFLFELFEIQKIYRSGLAGEKDITFQFWSSGEEVVYVRKNRWPDPTFICHNQEYSTNQLLDLLFALLPAETQNEFLLNFYSTKRQVFNLACAFNNWLTQQANQQMIQLFKENFSFQHPKVIASFEDTTLLAFDVGMYVETRLTISHFSTFHNFRTFNGLAKNYLSLAEDIIFCRPIECRLMDMYPNICFDLKYHPELRDLIMYTIVSQLIRHIKESREYRLVSAFDSEKQINPHLLTRIQATKSIV